MLQLSLQISLHIIITQLYFHLLGDSIGRIEASDCDANSPFNVLKYFIDHTSSSLARQYFDIRVNGDVYVRDSLISDTRDTLVYIVSSCRTQFVNAFISVNRAFLTHFLSYFGYC